MKPSREEKPPDYPAAAFNGVAGLSIDRTHGNWRGEWGEAIGLPPDRFARLWTDGLPGQANLHLSFTGGGQGDWSLSSPELNAEGHFSRAHGTLFLKEVRIENADQRRHGAGKRFFGNLVAACRQWGISQITLKGGREDGAYFWSRRGAYIEPYFVDRFKADIRDELKRLKGDVAADTLARINDVLDTGGPDVAARLVRLPDTIKGQPAGVMLLRHLEPRMVFNLDDEEQMKRIVEGLRDAPGGTGGISNPAPVMV